MNDIALLLPTALVLGALHSFAPDHLAAVSVFASRRPSWRYTAGLGARWGIGHSLTIFLVGGAFALAGLRIPLRFGALAETLVGVTLIGIGLLAVARALKLHGHWHAHDGDEHWHLHTHRQAPGHDHSHRALLGIGVLHGLAGTGALVVALPVAVAESPSRALIFLLAFGIGTVVSMSLFGALVGHVFGTAARVSARLHRRAVVFAGACSVILGLWWIV
jgi:sulfite exporter TauE/SafE